MNLKINALADGNAEILIYGEIGSNWYDEVNPKEFANQLKQCKAEILTVRINSGGGDMTSGHAIYNLIKSYHGKVRCVVDGIAASAASLIAMAGELLMPKNSLLMIHNAKIGIYGDDKKMLSIAKTLQAANQSMVEVYAAKTGIDQAIIKTMMDDETYMTADEAVAKGFADGILDALEINACIDGGELLLNGIKFDADVTKKFREIHPEIQLPLKASTNDNQAANLAANFFGKDATMLTVDNLKKDNPDIYAAIYELGKKDGLSVGKDVGIKSERQRHCEIDDLESHGFGGLMIDAKYKSGCSAGELAVSILKAQKTAVSKLQQNITEDADKINAIVALQTDPTQGIDPAAKAEEAFFAGIKDFVKG